MQIIGTGLSGLVGTQIVKYFGSDFEFENLSLETGVDITEINEVTRRIEGSSAEWIFHLAAVTDVDRVEKEKDLGIQGRGWRVNVDATANLVRLAKRTGKNLLYISTDYVFSGDKESYVETDFPEPLSWYGRTKWEGEKLVLEVGKKGLVVRIANPYGGDEGGKKDFVQKILERLNHKEQVIAPADQKLVPTFLEDIVMAIYRLVNLHESGIYHVVGEDVVTPFEAATQIAEVWGFDPQLVVPTTFAKYFAGRAQRPQRAILKHDKISELGIKMRSFREGLEEIHGQ